MKSFTSKSSKATGRESPLRSSAIKEREYTSNLSAQNQQRLYRLAERLENIKVRTTNVKNSTIAHVGNHNRGQVWQNYHS